MTPYEAEQAVQKLAYRRVAADHESDIVERIPLVLALSDEATTFEQRVPGFTLRYLAHYAELLKLEETIQRGQPPQYTTGSL